MQLFVNNWSSSLELPATASAVQLSVPSADAALLTGLGAGDYYLLTLAQVDLNGIETAWEVVRVTGNTAGVLDVLRAQEGTAALELEAGTSISARLTQATMEELRDNGGPALSDAAPQALGVAAAGTSAEASRGDHVHALPTPAEIGAATTAQGATADSAVQPGALAAVATTGSYTDLTDKPFIPAAPGDIGAATAAQGDAADTAVQPGALTTALAGKVNVDGAKVLSDENYTPAEKTKLAGLEAQHYRGTYTNLTALQSAVPTGVAGDYADVDAGAADPVLRYIWDDSDSEWVAQAGSADPITAAQVKTLYESNADTNSYTDAEKAKLAAIAAGATANADTDSLAEGATNKWFTDARVRAALATGLSFADSTVIAATDSFLQIAGKLAARLATAFDRANHTGVQAISTVTGLQTALDAVKVQSIIVAASDETTALTAGAAKVTFRMPYAFTVTSVRASLTTAQATGSILTVDINESATTILSTKLTIDNTEKTSVTAVTPAVISDTALANDAEITIDIDQIGDGTAKGLKVYLIGSPA